MGAPFGNKNAAGRGSGKVGIFSAASLAGGNSGKVKATKNFSQGVRTSSPKFRKVARKQGFKI